MHDRHFAVAERAMQVQPPPWLTPLHRAEWTHALEQHVFRGELSAGDATKMVRYFENDRKAGLWIEVPLPPTVFERCIDLAKHYISRVGCRTLDTLHVAVALELHAGRFLTLDRRQARLASLLGLKGL